MLYFYLLAGSLQIIVNIFNQGFTSKDSDAIEAASKCDIKEFPQSAKKQLQQMLPKSKASKFIENFVLNGWFSEYNKYLIPTCLLLNDGALIFAQESNEIVVLCPKCSQDSFEFKFEELLFEKRAVLLTSIKLSCPEIPNYANENFMLFTKHASLSSVEDHLENVDVNIALVKSILERHSDTFSRDLVLKLGKYLLSEVKKSLFTPVSKKNQIEIAETISLISKIRSVGENMFANHLKMLFFYAMSSDSKIAPEAEKLIQDMCMNRGMNIQLIFSIHRMNFLEIIVMLAVKEYSRHKTSLRTSMKSVSYFS